MTLEQYIDSINKRYKLGNATEHTFRGDLQQLLESLVLQYSNIEDSYNLKCKWLKDRKLEFNDIQHYQKIIIALTETDRLMKEINKIDIE